MNRQWIILPEEVMDDGRVHLASYGEYSDRTRDQVQGTYGTISWVLRQDIHEWLAKHDPLYVFEFNWPLRTYRVHVLESNALFFKLAWGGK